MNKKIIFLSYVIISILAAQSGYIKTPDQLYNSINNKLPSGSELFTEDIQYKELDLSSNMPKPGYQGKLGSCAAWAAGYACKTFQEVIESSQDPLKKEHQFSPSFLYNLVNNGENHGTTLPDVFNIMIDVGAATFKTMPYTDDYLKQPGENAFNEASSYKIRDYKRLNNSRGLLSAIKSSLANNQPIIVALKVYENFKKLKNEIYSEIHGEYIGGHGMCIVGYDDNTKTIKLINSWGKNWGENGYCRISYDLIDKLIIEAYVMYDINIHQKDKTLSTPINLKAGEGSNTKSVYLSWDNVQGAELYHIYRSNSKNEKLELLKKVSHNSFHDETVLNKVKYIYSIRAQKGAQLSDYSEIVCGWASKEDLGIPGNVRCSITNNVPYLLWDKVENAEGYYIYRWKDNQENYKRIAKCKGRNFLDTTIPEKTAITYYYLVTAFNGNEESAAGNMVKALLNIPDNKYFAQKDEGESADIEPATKQQESEIIPEDEQTIFDQELKRPDFYDSDFIKKFFEKAREAEEEAFRKMRQQEEKHFEQFRQQEKGFKDRY